MKFTKYGVRYWFDTFSHLKPFDILSCDEVVELYLKNHSLLGKDKVNVGGWNEKPINSTTDKIEKGGFWSGYPPAYYNIDPTGKKVTQAKADVISMDINGVGETWDNFIYLELPAQFIKVFQNKVHSNPDISLFKRFIKNHGTLPVDQMLKKSDKMDINHPEVLEFDNFFRTVKDPAWRTDLELGQYTTIRDEGLIYPICYPNKKFIYKRGTHRAWFCAMTDSDIPIFIQVPKSDWKLEELDEYNWNVQFEDNFTDVASMNIDRESECLTFYVGDRQVGEF